MRRATRVCQGSTTSPAHAVQGKQGQLPNYQSNVYAVCVTLAKVMMSMPVCRDARVGRGDGVEVCHGEAGP